MVTPTILIVLLLRLTACDQSILLVSIGANTRVRRYLLSIWYGFSTIKTRDCCSWKQWRVFVSIGRVSMASLLIILLCVITSQAAEDTVVTNLIVEATTSAANQIDDSESLVCYYKVTNVNIVAYKLTLLYTNLSSLSCLFHTNSWRGIRYLS